MAGAVNHHQSSPPAPSPLCFSPNSLPLDPLTNIPSTLTLSRQVPTSLEEYDDAILSAFGDALGPSVVERYPLTQFSNNAAAAYVQARSDAQVRAQLPQCARRVYERRQRSAHRVCRQPPSPSCEKRGACPCENEVSSPSIRGISSMCGWWWPAVCPAPRASFVMCSQPACAGATVNGRLCVSPPDPTEPPIC